VRTFRETETSFHRAAKLFPRAGGTSFRAVNSFHRAATAFHRTETSCHRAVKPFPRAEKSFFGAETSSHGVVQSVQHTVKPDDFNDSWLELSHNAQITDRRGGKSC
jgi:hypothetical protein